MVEREFKKLKTKQKIFLLVVLAAAALVLINSWFSLFLLAVCWIWVISEKGQKLFLVSQKNRKR